MTEIKLNLLQKLAQVYDKVDHIEKAGRNDRQKYDFVRAADVLRAIRKALSELGIYAQTNYELLGTYDIKTNSGGVMHTATVKVTITFYDAETSASLTVSGLGDGADSGDKGIYKAMTGATKNALRNAFLVPDEADPEADQSVDDAVLEPDPQPELPRRARRVNQEPAEDRGSRPEGGFRERTHVPAAEIPVSVSSDPTEASFVDAVAIGENDSMLNLRPEIPAADGKIASDTQLAEFGKRLRALGDDLGAKGGLKASRGLPVNRKVIAYLLSVTSAADATKISLNQWNTFFQFVDTMTALDNGYTKLAEIVNKISPEKK